MVAINKSPEFAAIRRKIAPILRKNGIKRAGIFGSYARGEQKEDSDIDLLVEITDKRSLLAIVNLQLQLQDALKRKVDLIEYNEIDPKVRDKILGEEIRLL